jgi:hypothetical protein
MSVGYESFTVLQSFVQRSTNVCFYPAYLKIICLEYMLSVLWQRAPVPKGSGLRLVRSNEIFLHTFSIPSSLEHL